MVPGTPEVSISIAENQDCIRSSQNLLNEALDKKLGSWFTLVGEL